MANAIYGGGGAAIPKKGTPKVTLAHNLKILDRVQDYQAKIDNIKRANQWTEEQNQKNGIILKENYRLIKKLLGKDKAAKKFQEKDHKLSIEND